MLGPPTGVWRDTGRGACSSQVYVDCYKWRQMSQVWHGQGSDIRGAQGCATEATTSRVGHKQGTQGTRHKRTQGTGHSLFVLPTIVMFDDPSSNGATLVPGPHEGRPLPWHGVHRAQVQPGYSQPQASLTRTQLPTSTMVAYSRHLMTASMHRHIMA